MAVPYRIGIMKVLTALLAISVVALTVVVYRQQVQLRGVTMQVSGLQGDVRRASVVTTPTVSAPPNHCSGVPSQAGRYLKLALAQDRSASTREYYNTATSTCFL